MNRPDERKLSKKETRPQIPNELLDNVEVSAMLANIDGSIELLNSIPQEEKIKAFVDSDHFLGNFYKELEQTPEITQTEAEALDIINEQLNNNKEVVNKIIDTLIESQRVNLMNRDVPRDTVDVEIKHIKEVVALTQRIFPNMPILHLAAAVHDSYKYNLDGQMELALHELAGTALGPLLVEKLLQKHKSELVFGDEGSKREISQTEINLIIKLVQRTIETHGTDEFPDLNADFSDTENPNIGVLFGSVKPKPTKKSWELLKQETNVTSMTVAGLNYLDAITGTNYTSFIKYNNPVTYPNRIFIQEIQSPTDYITKKLFSSFDSNIAMISGKLLSDLDNKPGEQNIDELKSILEQNTRVKEAIERSLNKELTPLIKNVGYDNAVKILRLVVYLEKSFDKLRNKVLEKQQDPVEINYLNERAEFDVLLNLFIQTVHGITIDKISKEK